MVILEIVFYLLYYFIVSEKLLKASEVAERLGVKHVTVRSWLKRGLFSNAKLEETIAGKIWLIPENDLNGFELPKTGRPPKTKQKGK